jgi:hypothetical protein
MIRPAEHPAAAEHRGRETKAADQHLNRAHGLSIGPKRAAPNSLAAAGVD